MRFARSLCVSVDQRVGYRTHEVYVNNILYVPLARISGDVVAIATVIMFFASRAHPSLKFNHLSEGPSRSNAISRGYKTLVFLTFMGRIKFMLS